LYKLVTNRHQTHKYNFKPITEVASWISRPLYQTFISISSYECKYMTPKWH